MFLTAAVGVVALAGTALAGSYGNTTGIAIPSFGPALVSNLTITGEALVSNMAVTVYGFAHQRPDDVDVLLVGPGGQRVVLMSDSGSDNVVGALDLTFDDRATDPVTDEGALASGTYLPTNNGPSALCPGEADPDVFPGAPAGGTLGADLSVFDGTVPERRLEPLRGRRLRELRRADPRRLVDRHQPAPDRRRGDTVLREGERGPRRPHLEDRGRERHSRLRRPADRRPQDGQAELPARSPPDGPGPAVERLTGSWTRTSAPAFRTRITWSGSGSTVRRRGPAASPFAAADHLRRSFAVAATVSGRMKRVLVGVLLLSLGLTAAAVSGPSARGAAPPSAQAQQFALAGQKAMKLLVDKDGWYRVRFPDLQKAGFAIPRNTTNLQLWLNGAQVPILIPRGAVEFYGQGLDNDYTDTQAYWLVNGAAKGLRIPVVKAGLKAGQPQGSFGTSTQLLDRGGYAASILNGAASNFVGQPVRSGSVTTFKLKASHVNPKAPGAIKVGVQGFSLVAHNVKVTWNGVVVGTMPFKGQILQTQSFPLPAGAIQEGDNTLAVTATAGDIDISFFSSAVLSYQHTYTADADVLEFDAAAGKSTTVAGFTTKNVRVIDIGQPPAAA